MKILLSLFLSLIGQAVASQEPLPAASPGDHVSATSTKSVLEYINFSESRAAQLVAATQAFLKGTPTIQDANKLTGDIMRSSSQSEPYYRAALASSSGNPRLASAIEAFRAEELRLPRKLGNTDGEQLGDVTSALETLGDEVKRALSVNRN